MGAYEAALLHLHMRPLVVGLALAAGCQSPAPTTPTTIKPISSVVHPSGTLHAVQIAISEGHSCARMSDGTIRCWGDNAEGELGDGTTAERHTPVQVVGIEHAIDVFVSLGVSCVRIEDGRVICWGQTLFLEDVPDEDYTEQRERTAPHPIAGFANVQKVWMGREGDGCARWPGGQTKCWGMGAGSLAMGGGQDFPGPVVAKLANATEFAVAERLGCARMPDATVQCWGQDFGISPVTVKGLRDVAQVVVARESACARLVNGRVWCWGSNDAGQLGDGTEHERDAPVEVRVQHDIVDLAAGSLHVCGRHATGTVTCWGWNRAGELGNGKDLVESSGPVMVVGLDHVVQLALAQTHSCALRDDGEVYCWGLGWRGVLGDGLQADRSTPAHVNWTIERPVSKGLPANVHVTSVAVSMTHTCASFDDGTARCWGRNDDGIVDAVGTQESYATPIVVPGTHDVATVAIGMFNSSAMLRDGSVAAWGRKQRVHSLEIKPVIDFTDDGEVRCERRADGITTCYIDRDGVATIANTVQVAGSELMACVVLKDTTVACAGADDFGQLGDGLRVGRNHTFAPVNGLRDVAQVAVGGTFGCARLTNGTVRCWGDLGMNGEGSLMAPVDQHLSDVIDIAAGPDSVCARKRDGAVACWGRFVNEDTLSEEPTDVPWLHGATLFALGQNHSCALVPDGLACWGDNEAGELGDGTMDARDKAELVRW